MKKTFSLAIVASAALAAASSGFAQSQQQPSSLAAFSINSAAQTQSAGVRTASSGSSFWMHSDVSAAHQQGFRGQGATITIVDDHRNTFGRFAGNLTGVTRNQTHGAWVSQVAGLTAPSARLRSADFISDQWRPVSLDGSFNRCGWFCWRWQNNFNVINLSYVIMTPVGDDLAIATPQSMSIINHAHSGQAVVVKGAGNDAVAVGQVTRAGQVDQMSRYLVGARSAIFVGALSSHGSTSQQATMASYSNIAGTNRTVQNQFLVVGVEGDKTGMFGTSFAAPIVSGYAAVVHSKFNRASPTQVTNQLLSTARQDTIANFNPAVHGRGEASLSRALAPARIQ
jgi:hypothetical protein